MRHCAVCDKRFQPDEDYFWVCQDCIDEQNFDTTQGSPHWELIRLGGKLRNREWEDSEMQFVADCAWFPWLVERALPLVEHRQMKNLLNKVTERLA